MCPYRRTLSSRLASSLLVCALVAPTGCGGEPDHEEEDAFAKALPKGAIRVATFNASLNRPTHGELLGDLEGTDNEQARAAAEIVQRVRPDVLLLQEVDYDEDGVAAQLFHDNYLAVSQRGQKPVKLAHRLVPPVNTGYDSGFDLDNDGALGGPGDAYGFGEHEGQFGFVIYSRFPILEAEVRTFQNMLWKDMPDAMLPDDLSTTAPDDWYSAEELEVVRLSSKNHVDVPIDVDGTVVHLMAQHPTPPAFDGPEDRNGKRNHDEIRLFADYITPGAGGYLVDDQGRAGGLAEGERFVIAGDHNSDPLDGSSQAVRMLLEHPRVNGSLTPKSTGAAAASKAQGGINKKHKGNPAHDTGDFNDVKVGNLRLDYVLPSVELKMLDAKVFWPTPTSSLHPLLQYFDHRCTWIDVKVK
jgi:endonuclease/exonuclease/phosphatase family metal-dependent hydrolase